MRKKASAELLVKPCRKCAAVDRDPYGNCRPCAAARVTRYNKAHPDRISARNRAYHKANPEKERARHAARHSRDGDKIRASARERRRANPEYGRAAMLRCLYDLSIAEFNSILAAQGGVCAICHKPETVIDPRTGKIKAFHVDHDHVTGIVRGLLCNRHNRGIGFLDESPALLRAAADYLERNAVGALALIQSTVPVTAQRPDSINLSLRHYDIWTRDDNH